MQLAILREAGGDMHIKYPKTSKVSYIIIKEAFVLYFYHPISEEIKVKGEISFEKSFHYNSDEFRNNLYDLVFDLHESEENLKVNLKLGNNSGNSNNPGGTLNGNLDSKKKTKIGDIKKATKRKFVSELVNPNAKRRKGKGAKFINDEEFEEGSLKDKISRNSSELGEDDEN